MKRRDFIAGMGGALTWPLAARAQAPATGTGSRLPIVGFLGLSTPDGDRSRVEAFRKGLREVRQIEGRTVELITRHAGGDVARADAMITEFMSMPVSVFVVPGHAAARLVRRATTSIPIVGAGPFPTIDPLLFASIARPGGSFTGFSSFGEELSGKQIGLVREALPELKTLGIMHNGTDPTFSAWGDATEAAAIAQGLRPVRLKIPSPTAGALGELMQQFHADGGTAFIVVNDFMTATLRSEIVNVAAALRLVVIADQRVFAEAGALLSYGADLHDLLRRAAGHVDRILKGEKPGDLAIQLPTKFEMVLNLKVAQALGVRFPPLVLAQADEVIE